MAGAIDPVTDTLVRGLRAVAYALILAAAVASCQEEPPVAFSIRNDMLAPVEIWYAIDGAETRQTSVDGRTTIEPGASERFELDLVGIACTKHAISVRSGSDVVAIIPPCQRDRSITTVSFWPPDGQRPEASTAP